MRRRTHSPRSAVLVGVAVVGLAALTPVTASAVPPTVTANVTPSSPDGANGWYVSDVTIAAFSIDLQGQTETLPRDPDCDTPTPSSVTSDTTGITITCSVTTEGPDGGTTSTDVTIRRDATDPNLAPQITPATLVLNGPGNAAPNATDATSGIDTASCGPIETSAVGNFNVQCQATDLAGNQATEMVPYTVEPHGAAAEANATKGDGQTAYVTRRFASALAVTITDAQGNPVPGETVTFTAPSAGASADLSRPSDVTNANGVASIQAFANNRVGSYVVRGRLTGVGTARFDLRNAPAPYFADGFSNGLRKWRRTGDVSIAKGAGKPKPSALLRASDDKTFAVHRFGRAYATACASAWVRLNSVGDEAVALLRFRGQDDSGVSRVSVETDRELFVRNDHKGGVKLSGRRLPLGEWHEIELCTQVGGKGTISLYLDGAKVLGWRQGLGDRRIAAINLIENDVKTFSLNVDDVLVDRRPGTPV